MPLGIGGNTFGRARAGRFFVGIRNEVLDRSVLGAAHANTALPAVVIARDRLGFGIRGIEHIVLADVQTAGTAELLPLGDELAILIKDLDTVVIPVTDKQAALGVHCQRVRLIKVSGGGSKLAPGLAELT